MIEPSSASDYQYQFLIKNIPETWDVPRARQFIIDTVNSKHLKENMALFTIHKRVPRDEMFLLTFYGKEIAEEAFEILKETQIDGKFLEAIQLPCEPITQAALTGASQWNGPPPTFFEGNFQEDTYGLSIDFLLQLGIHPPLNPRIQIDNLPPSIDKEKIEEIFSLAGKIVTIFLRKNLDTATKCEAVVVYDHPVEAVQAITMFNRRTLYGQQLHICIDTETENNDSSNILPPGLHSIGPGLGDNGQPLQYARINTIIEEIKEIIRDWLNKANENSENRLKFNTQVKWQSDLFKSLSQENNLLSFGHCTNGSSAANSHPPVQASMKQLNNVNELNTLNTVNPIQAFLGLLSIMANQSSLTTREPDKGPNQQFPCDWQ